MHRKDNVVFSKFSDFNLLIIYTENAFTTVSKISGIAHFFHM